MKRKIPPLRLNIITLCLLTFSINAFCQQTKINGTMMQYFDYFLPDDGTLWKTLEKDAANLKDMGITAVWLPPAYKGDKSDNVGYTAYDLYDLGEFDQHGTVRTKYGTKQEYLDAIKALHNHNIHVYADIVFNHKGSADANEPVTAIPVDTNDRNKTVGPQREILAWTRFNFPGRNNKYSNFKWCWYHFDGVDFDQKTGENKIFRLIGENKYWDGNVDLENGNYDYLMYADVDFQHPEVVDELTTWGKWYLAQTGIDGFRIDAVKHIDHTFFTDWLKTLRQQTGNELFTVGEYLSRDVNVLLEYLKNSKYCMSLFDFPLQNHFKYASLGSGFYNLKDLLAQTLVSKNPILAVTFVENHDTQYGRDEPNPVEHWFKPLAYTFIMTREQGYPCLFYGDYYGVPSKYQPAMKQVLYPILQARKLYAYGTQHNYLDQHDTLGWTREGDPNHPNSGLAALICDGRGGTKSMYIGTHYAKKEFKDMTGNDPTTVTIDDKGYGQFRVNDHSWSIWVLK